MEETLYKSNCRFLLIHIAIATGRLARNGKKVVFYFGIDFSRTVK